LLVLFISFNQIGNLNHGEQACLFTTRLGKKILNPSNGLTDRLQILMGEKII
jgi:hypothetical protein